MHGKSYLFSALLHATIILFLWYDWSFMMTDFEKSSTPVILVDLKKVQIGELTNLPPKVNKQNKKAPVKTPESSKQKTPTKTATSAPSPKPAEPIKPKEKSAKKDAATAIEAPKKSEPKQKPQPKPDKKIPPKPKPTQQTAPQKDKPKKDNSDLKSLLASVDAIKKNARPSSQTTAPTETGQEVQQGIDGGTEGSLMQPLTISEKDLIVTKLRGCWSVDAGATGIEEMVIEVRAYVNRDGRIRDVKILNMNNNPSFRAIAESARRAIYICDALGDESPFKMLADKRPDSYDHWKEIFVRFSPLDGGIY